MPCKRRRNPTFSLEIWAEVPVWREREREGEGGEGKGEGDGNGEGEGKGEWEVVS